VAFQKENQPVTIPAFDSSDWIFLIIVLAIAGGIVYAVKGSAINESIEKQKEAMKVSFDQTPSVHHSLLTSALFLIASQQSGIHLSTDGLSVKTNRVKVSREEEVVSA
jgi:hypothetical protein